MIQQQALQFLEDFTGQKADEFRALAQSGSARINFYANSGGKEFIVTSNSNIAENESFFYFSELFSELNLNTPEIFKISADRTLYIQEFLGNKTLSEIISEEGLSEKVKSLVKQVLEKLYLLQTATSGKVDYSKTFEYEKYNELPVTNDLFYFKSFIAEVLEIPYHKSRLLTEFQTITRLIETLEPKVLMIRDFQARNIMINDSDEVFFIDYQSAMEGPAMYDVVSFLFQAKANFPQNFKNEMLNYYISLFDDSETRKNLKQSVEPIQLMRFLQVLGAYGFRGLIQKKPHFISSLDAGIKNLTDLAENWQKMHQFPELKSLILKLKSEEIQQKIISIKSNIWAI